MEIDVGNAMMIGEGAGDKHLSVCQRQVGSRGKSDAGATVRS